MGTAGRQEDTVSLIMDRAYEEGETRCTARTLKFAPVVPPKSNRLLSREYDQELCKRGNEVERVFRLLQVFRRVFSGFDKLDAM